VPAKRNKEARVWEGGSGNIKDPKALNYSADGNNTGSNGVANGVNGTGLGVDVSVMGLVGACGTVYLRD